MTKEMPREKTAVCRTFWPNTWPAHHVVLRFTHVAPLPACRLSYLFGSMAQRCLLPVIFVDAEVRRVSWTVSLHISTHGGSYGFISDLEGQI